MKHPTFSQWMEAKNRRIEESETGFKIESQNPGDWRSRNIVQQSPASPSPAHTLAQQLLNDPAFAGNYGEFIQQPNFSGLLDKLSTDNGIRGMAEKAGVTINDLAQQITTMAHPSSSPYPPLKQKWITGKIE